MQTRSPWLHQRLSHREQLWKYWHCHPTHGVHPASNKNPEIYLSLVEIELNFHDRQKYSPLPFFFLFFVFLLSQMLQENPFDHHWMKYSLEILDHIFFCLSRTVCGHPYLTHEVARDCSDRCFAKLRQDWTESQKGHLLPSPLITDCSCFFFHSLTVSKAKSGRPGSLVVSAIDHGAEKERHSFDAGPLLPIQQLLRRNGEAALLRNVNVDTVNHLHSLSLWTLCYGTLGVFKTFF